ncbi:hypothetical protein ABGV42_00975 [Paenibacillus pabuli]|uniref:hypothetical protein n=1 Tax=Paenibacillus pabuli TaxID=1472 RepID=UPI0032423C64
MKRKIMGITTAVLMLALVGCGKADVTEVADTAVSASAEVTAEATTEMETREFQGITFEFDKSYTKVDEKTDTNFTYAAYLMDAANSTSFNIVVENLPADITLEKYMELSFGGSGMVADSEETVEKNGITWSVVSTNNQGLKLDQHTFIENKKAYIFTYASMPDGYDALYDTYLKIIDSVKLTEK